MKTIRIIIFIICGLNSSLQAQEILSQDSIELHEVVISANKVEELRQNVPYQIASIPAKQIRFQNGQTMANVLENSGSILVQRSQQGGGSPIIRGFEASRILLVIDGVRMNNLIYRAGHLQNIMTIDPSLLERAEILYGPSSTVYGSDALGGTIHFLTKKPVLNTSEKKIFSQLNAALRYGSVNQEKTAHVNFNLGTKKFASLSAISISDFGDLRMGKHNQALDTLWGLRIFQQGEINGRDTMLRNDDKFQQSESGYQQYDVMQKFLWQQNIRMSHLLNFQFSNSSNLPRYDRLTDLNAAKTHFSQAEWYYGPQKRLMGSYTLSISELGFFNKINTNINFQDIEESRHTRSWQNATLTSRIEKVKVAGAAIDFIRNKTLHDIRAGIDFQYSEVKSRAFSSNIFSGQVAVASTRYPDGQNRQSNFGFYATHTWRISDQLILSDGLRLQQNNLKSTFISQQFYQFPFNEIKQNNLGWSGNLGLIYKPISTLKFSVMTSSGFRSPNVDDLSKVFDTNVRDRLVVVPNPDLEPEKTYNIDLGFALYLNDKINWENTLFVTWMQDAIVISDYTYNGQDSILYDGILSKVRAPQNQDKAFVTGFSSQLKFNMLSHLTMNAGIHFIRGRVTNNDDEKGNLDHIPPTHGRFGLLYDKNKIQAEIYSLFNAWKRIEEYRLGAEDNEQYATPAGMPYWWTMNLKCGYAWTKHLSLQAGIENIFDIQYRVFASGIHAAGRNIYGTLRLSF